MDIRCENCGKLLAVSDSADCRIEGTIEIKCQKCKHTNVISGLLNKGFVSSS